MSFPWPGTPAGWANQGVVGDGTIQTISTADRNRGFRVDGVATLPKLNAIVRELANQIGFLFDGWALDGDGASRNAGGVAHWPRFGALVDNTPVGRVASCSEFSGDVAPFQRTGGTWGGGGTSIDATYVWTDGSDFIWYVNDSGGGGTSTYGSARRQTTQALAGTDWTVSLGAAFDAISIVGVNNYLYVVIDDNGAPDPGLIRKVLKTTGQTVASVNLTSLLAPTKIVSNGEVLCVSIGSVVEAYDLDLNFLWSWSRGSTVEDIAITGDALFAVGAIAVVDAVANVNMSRINLATGLKTHQVTSATINQDLDHVTADGRVVIATADVAAADNVVTVTAAQLGLVEVRQVGTVWQPRNIQIDHSTIYLTVFDTGLAGTLFLMFARSWTPIGRIPILGLGSFDTDGINLYIPGGALSGWSLSRFGLGFPLRMFVRNDPEASPYALWTKLAVPL